MFQLSTPQTWTNHFQVILESLYTYALQNPVSVAGFYDIQKVEKEETAHQANSP
ncbi:hypothetical protein SynBIOSU31_01501 [Synechococcus sp. BIOS-U3-1]|nr:hypothetical protein SynBIOSU31_01501 [Synechococcus sp. BIOS-U3-1]